MTVGSIFSQKPRRRGIREDFPGICSVHGNSFLTALWVFLQEDAVRPSDFSVAYDYPDVEPGKLMSLE